MRVCLLTLDFPPFRSSGLTIYAESVARGLVQRGHKVTVVAARRPEGERVPDARPPEGVDVLRVPTGRTDWIGLGWHAAKYLRAHRSDFDAVHFADVHFAYAYRGPFVASAFQSFRQRLTGRAGRPYATDRWDALFRLLYYSGARWFMERPAIRRALHIVASSDATREEFITHYGVEESRISRVYLGINLRRFAHLPGRDLARRRLGLPSDEPILLYVGFSTPRKGLEYLAQGMTLMQTPAHLVIVGKWSPRYRERFEEGLGPLVPRVHAVGYVEDTELPLYYAAADLFVLPTLLEGFGIPLVEGMAAGLPVVTTTGGSAGEVAGPGGLAVPPADPVRLAHALDRVLTDEGLAQRLGQAGLERARSLFNEARTATEIEAIYAAYFI